MVFSSLSLCPEVEYFFPLNFQSLNFCPNFGIRQ